MEFSATPPQFRIDRALYERELKERVSKVFEPQHCVIFAFPLPFQLPLKNNTCFQRGFGNLVNAFLFERYETESQDATFPEGGPSTLGMKTRVEMALILPETPIVRGMTDMAKITGDPYVFLYSNLVHLLHRLNTYIYAYRLLFEDCNTHSLSVEQFLTIYTQIHTLPGWEVQTSGPLFVPTFNFNHGTILTNVEEKWVNVIEGLGMYLDRTKSEFVAAFQFYADARRYLYRGDFREAVVFTGMSSEAFLNGIFRHVRLLDGKSDAEIEAEFDDIPFKSRIKKHISHAVGGDWDLTRNKSPAGKWHQHVYELRNRVIHGGHFPSQHEGTVAFITFVSFAEFLRERISANKVKLGTLHAELANLPKFFVQGEETHTFDLS